MCKAEFSLRSRRNPSPSEVEILRRRRNEVNDSSCIILKEHAWHVSTQCYLLGHLLNEPYFWIMFIIQVLVRVWTREKQISVKIKRQIQEWFNPLTKWLKFGPAVFLWSGRFEQPDFLSSHWACGSIRSVWGKCDMFWGECQYESTDLPQTLVESRTVRQMKDPDTWEELALWRPRWTDILKTQEVTAVKTYWSTDESLHSTNGSTSSNNISRTSRNRGNESHKQQ